MVVYVVVVLVALVLIKVVVSKRPSKINLKDAHIMITGGSSGIGLEIAKICASKGAVISLLARNVQRLETAKKEIEKFSTRPEGQSCHFVSVDISKDCSEVQSAVSKLTRDCGPVDMLFNCAGTSQAAAFMDLPIEKFNQLMQINYIGAVYCTRAVMESMKERKQGRIVFLSSQAGQTGVYGYTAYSASKFALRGFAETLQMEVKHLNIGITISFPPDTDTPGFEEENKGKPKATRLISGDGAAFRADVVAASIVNDAVQGNFMNYIGLDGFILGHVSAGMAPCNSFVRATIQFLLMGIFRVVSLGYLKSFNNIVLACSTKSTSKKQD